MSDFVNLLNAIDENRTWRKQQKRGSYQKQTFKINNIGTERPDLDTWLICLNYFSIKQDGLIRRLGGSIGVVFALCCFNWMLITKAINMVNINDKMTITVVKVVVLKQMGVFESYTGRIVCELEETMLFRRASSFGLSLASRT